VRGLEGLAGHRGPADAERAVDKRVDPVLVDVEEAIDSGGSMRSSGTR
jgi:hypothetical protein